MHIRPYTSADLAALHAINVEGEPGVGAVSKAKLEHIIDEGICLVADDADGPLGFLLLLGEDADYDSQNYQWFEARYESFVYVDRIAIASHAQGKRLGTTLYEAGFKRFTGKALLMGCEVNTAPPNPASLRFHKRLGFEQIGTQSFSEDYAVAYLARRLSK